jgi:hypothetical protein
MQIQQTSEKFTTCEVGGGNECFLFFPRDVYFNKSCNYTSCLDLSSKDLYRSDVSLASMSLLREGGSIRLMGNTIITSRNRMHKKTPTLLLLFWKYAENCVAIYGV